MTDFIMTDEYQIAKTFYDRNALAYHNWDHVLDLLNKIPKEIKDMGASARTLETAIVWHDSVYYPGAKNNEARSAELFCIVRKTNNKNEPADGMLGWDNTQQIVDTILATKDHEVVNENVWQEEVIIDLDLFGLSADWPDYVNNGRKIKKEFADLIPVAFRDGRKEFIRKFLAKDKIYKSGFFFNRELRARYNLEKELYLLNNNIDYLTEK